MAEQSTKKRGLASADEQTRAEVARKGGRTVSQNRAHMAEIGRKGGETVSQNRAHMAEIGRKGGKARMSHATKTAPQPSAQTEPPKQQQPMSEPPTDKDETIRKAS